MKAALLISLKVLALDIPLLALGGTFLGWILARKRFPGRELVSVLLLLPVTLPPSVLGLYVLVLFGGIAWIRRLGILFSFTAAALAALIPSLPIMIQAARAGFAAVPVCLEEAARTLGDTERRVLRRITIPLARRQLAAGLALASVRALGEFGLTLMIAGNIPGRSQTLPLYIYSRIETLEFSRAHAAAGLLTAVGFASLWLVRHLEGGRHERKL